MAGARHIALILLGFLGGCSHLVPSGGYVHTSDPNAGRYSPNPGASEIQTDFLGAGMTVEFENTDIHIWGGLKRTNGENSPGAAVIVAQKFRKKGD